MTPAEADIVRLGDVGSTNDEAMSRLREGAISPFWVTAERQLSGRGRRGRTWISEPGNLYATYAFRPDLPIEVLGLVPLAAAVALAEALPDRVAARLKWPNDVLVAGRKCAGILIETETSAGKPGRRVVIGYGVNIAHHPSDAPATHLRIHDHTIDAPTVLGALCRTLPENLAVLAGPSGIRIVRERWMARAVGIGAPVIVRYESESVEGRFLGLDPLGRLILGQDGGATRLIAAGDVFVRTERL